MAVVYFVRHAESDNRVEDQRLRPLAFRGLGCCGLVTEFLGDKGVDIVLSSPYRRAIETVRPFAESLGLPVGIIEDFRERELQKSLPREEWPALLHRQWLDFSLRINGESLADVQSRNIAALEQVLAMYADKTIVIGTHGTALSTIIAHYDPTYGFDNQMAMIDIMPWFVRMDFSPEGCMGMEKTNPFAATVDDYENCIVRTAPLGSMKAYRYTVIFARYRDQWLYCRHKERDTFETAGGHIEKGETPEEAAKRELYEETGATKFELTPLYDYAVHVESGYANGVVFLAEVEELDKLPNFEMAETALFDTIPSKLRLPGVLPKLFQEMTKARQKRA